MPALLDLETCRVEHEPIVRLLQRELEEVSLIFERQLASDLTAVNALCRHIERYRGKMLRPTLVLLCGLAASPGEVKSGKSSLTDTHRIIAAVVEMIHMATLVHDDVLDDAEVRRRGATVNHLHGNEAAVMLGDYLISNAFHLCSTAGDPAINLALGEVTNTLCEGELVQLHHRDDYSIDDATYFEIVTRKTASLIGECCRLGAVVSGASDSVGEALRRFGLALGIAFQIQDDLLDIAGEPRVVGKSLGKDLDKGKLTLPLIRHLAIVTPIERGEALRLIQARDGVALQRCIIDSGSVDSTRRTAAEHVRAATMELAHLPATAARNVLESLAAALASRSY